MLLIQGSGRPLPALAQLMLMEGNYDVGNHDLLAVVLALQEWRTGWRGQLILLLSGLETRT